MFDMKPCARKTLEVSWIMKKPENDVAAMSATPLSATVTREKKVLSRVGFWSLRCSCGAVSSTTVTDISLGVMLVRQCKEPAKQGPKDDAVTKHGLNKVESLAL